MSGYLVKSQPSAADPAILLDSPYTHITSTPTNLSRVQPAAPLVLSVDLDRDSRPLTSHSGVAVATGSFL